MGSIAALAPRDTVSRSQWRVALLPLDSGPGEIASIDGLRAIAALSVMLFHAYYLVSRSVVVAGIDITALWNYGQSGVHLFFVLSGFLLFMPYARAMLAGRPLPSARRFFQRRALRILPAYWACLAILSLVQFTSLVSPAGLANVGMHLLMLHDDVAVMNRAIEGPFWSLAVEAQFYLALPIMAWIIAKVVGQTGSRKRIIGGVLAMLIGALALRSGDAYIQGHFARHPGVIGALATLFVHATLGIQGKYLEVFALGMLCSVLYLAAQEESRRLRRSLRWIGPLLIALALVAIVLLAQVQLHQDILTPPYFLFMSAGNLRVICAPLVAGLPYAALVLGALWSPRWLRAAFEAAPLRFVGFISYSLYLWHLPILTFAAPYALRAPESLRIAMLVAVGFFVAIPVAYLSYQLIERPFLAQRRRLTPQLA
ncbi:MAG TPA: acyltransferase [Ktedonobacterales bacterium]